jgi:hypothetical protein
MSSQLFVKFVYIQPDPEPLLLDSYPGADAAYSFRLLRNDYTGQCCRIRESVGNTETDIGFVDGYVDIATMETFKGAGNIFVVTIYDQSGNARDISNSTAAQQAQATVSTVINYSNGFFAPRFNNGPNLWVNSFISGYPIHNFVVGTNLNSGDNGFLCGGSELTTDNNRYFADYINNGTARASLIEAQSSLESLTVGTRSGSDAALTAAAFLHLNISDKSINANETVNTTTSFTRNPFAIDTYSVGNIKRPIGGISGVAGDFCENIVYLTDQSANEAAIIANQIAYYGIL